MVFLRHEGVVAETVDGLPAEIVVEKEPALSVGLLFGILGECHASETVVAVEDGSRSRGAFLGEPSVAVVEIEIGIVGESGAVERLAAVGLSLACDMPGHQHDLQSRHAVVDIICVDELLVGEHPALHDLQPAPVGEDESLAHVGIGDGSDVEHAGREIAVVVEPEIAEPEVEAP